MVVRNNNYQQSVFFSSSNTVMASFYATNNTITDYFHLKSANESLASENTALKNQLTKLQNKYDAIENYNAVNKLQINPEKELNYIDAKVINNSTNKLLNYITINKGKRDGIYPDMGVINEDGVIGVVANVSDKFAVIIPILNPKIQINSKFSHNNYSGPVHWDGNDYRFAKLNDIARHVIFNKGDTIVTSGYSSSFPEGLIVGTVQEFNIKDSDAYYHIKVELSVNFKTLTHVKVINYKYFQEQNKLEKSMIE